METFDAIANGLLFLLVAAGGPLITIWGVLVVYRCTSASTQKAFRVLVVLMIACVTAAVLAGPVPGAAVVVLNLVVMLVVELLIGFGIVRTAHGFRSLFRHLPLDVKIVNRGAREIYRTAASRTLDVSTLKQLVTRAAKSDEADGVVTVRQDAWPDTTFTIFRLNAGYAIVAEDRSELNAQTRRLQAIRDDLTRQNELIAHDRDIKRALYRQQRERELNQKVSRDLAESAADIGELLDTLPPLSDERSALERLKQLNHVKVLVAYSKRKGMLALAAAESDTMTSDAFRLITDETCADLRSIGIEAAVLVELSSDLPVNVVNMVYDCFYDCIRAVLPFAQPVIMTYIAPGQDGEVHMRSSIECAIGLSEENAVELIPKKATSAEAWDAVQRQIARGLDERLRARDVHYEMTSDEGLVNVHVYVSEGGEPR